MAKRNNTSVSAVVGEEKIAHLSGQKKVFFLLSMCIPEA